MPFIIFMISIFHKLVKKIQDTTPYAPPNFFIRQFLTALLACLGFLAFS